MNIAPLQEAKSECLKAFPRGQFTMASQEAGCIIRKEMGRAAYEVAAFHVLIGSTISPQMRIRSMDFDSFHLADVFECVGRHIKTGVPVAQAMREGLGL